MYTAKTQANASALEARAEKPKIVRVLGRAALAACANAVGIAMSRALVRNQVVLGRTGSRTNTGMRPPKTAAVAALTPGAD